jgi:hypothetical protein
MIDRGQTVHDYLFGILLVLLTIAGVFAFFPDVFVPFQEEVAEEDRDMAARLADAVIEANATATGERTVNLTGLERTLGDSDRFGRLVNRSGIPDWKRVNVTVQDERGTVLVAGETDDVGSVFRNDRSAGTRVRTARAANRSSDCTDGCQVVVRVW